MDKREAFYYAGDLRCTVHESSVRTKEYNKNLTVCVVLSARPAIGISDYFRSPDGTFLLVCRYFFSEHFKRKVQVFT